MRNAAPLGLLRRFYSCLCPGIRIPGYTILVAPRLVRPRIGTVRYPRLVPKDEECAKQLAKRTLTNLYSTRPTWLDLAHQRLDAAVSTAHGWPADLPDGNPLATTGAQLGDQRTANLSLIH